MLVFLLAAAGLGLCTQRVGPRQVASRYYRAMEPRMMARVDVRPADGSGPPASFQAVANLCAEGLFTQPASGRDTAVLSTALGNDLIEHFSRRNREKNALLLAEDSVSGAVVGSVGIEVVFLSAAGYSARRQREQDVASMAPRPLLSNLVVDRTYRRRGIAKRLCRGAEAAAKGWGYSEVFLKVETGNRKARALYHSLGYRSVTGGEDGEAERPVVLGGRLRYEPTTTIALKKDLTRPPADVLANGGFLFAAAAAVAANAQSVEQLAFGAVARALGADAATAAEEALLALLGQFYA